MDGDAVVEEAELLKALDALDPRRRKSGEGVESGFAIGVDAEMFAIAGEAGGIAVVGDGGAGEVEGAVVGGGDDLDGVGIGDVVGRTADGKGGYLDIGAVKELEERGEMLGREERLVALDVDVDVGGDGLSDGVDAIGAAGAVFGREDSREAARLGEGENFFGVGGDEDLIEERAAACGAVDPGEHGLAGDFAEDLAGEASGAEAGGDDGKDAAEVRGQGEFLLRQCIGGRGSHQNAHQAMLESVRGGAHEDDGDTG